MPTPEEIRKKFEEQLAGGATPTAAPAPTTAPAPTGGRLNLSTGDPATKFRERLAQVAPLSQKKDESKLQSVLGALDFASSGDTFLKRISGNRLRISDLDTPLPDWIDSKIRGGLDLTFNPLTAASVIAAPVAVPARIAASPLGRLAFRLGAETVVGAAAGQVAKETVERMPEDAPSWMKLAAPIGAAIAVGGVSTGAVNRAISPKAAANLYLQDLRATAAASGYRHLAPLERLETIAKSLPTSDNPVTRKIFTELGIDPAVGEATDAGRMTHAYLRQKGVAREASGVSLAAALPKGFDAFDIQGGVIKNVPKAGNRQWNDVFADPNAPKTYGFNEAQTQQWQTATEILEDTRTLLRDNGVDIGIKELAESLYIPRQVAVGKGERPSSAFLARIYDEATEAVRTGNVEYLDPNETFRLHIEAAYKHVADEQFSDAIEALTIAPSKAYATTPRGKALTAQWREKVEAFQKVSRTEGVYTDRGKRLRARISEARRAGDDARVKKLEADLEANNISLEQIRASMKAARVAKAATKNKLQSDFKAFRQSDRTKLSGHLFGRSDETIDVEKWKNSFIPKDQYDVLSKWFDTQRGRLLQNNPAKPIRVVQDAGDVLRTTSATADFSMPFIQGLPLLAADPVAWSKMAVAHYKAFWNPGTVNRYIARNKESMQDMIVHGRVPAGDVEFFAATRDGAYSRIADGIEKLPGGELATGAVRNTAGRALNRFESAYNAGLLVARHELWSSLRPTWPGTAEELGAFVRNSTGGMDTAALGVGQAQRAAESLAFFSPKLLRSTAALFAKATRPWTAEGAEAAHTILRLSSAAGGIFVLANIAVGTAAGETEAQINERVQKVLSPWEGKEFLSVRVGDEWYGVGGQVRAMTQFVANSIVGLSNTAGLTDEDTGASNPITAFLMNRVSPAVRAGTAATEYLTDEKLNLMPFDTIDSVPDLFSTIGTSGLPFAVQGLLEASEDPLRDPSLSLTLSELLGARATPISPFERRDDEVMQAFDGLRYRDLTPEQKTLFDKAHPELTTAADEYGDLAQREYNGRIKEIDAETTGTLNAISQAVANGRYQTRAQMREDIEDALTARAIKLQEARNGAGLDDEMDPTSLSGKLLNAYYYTFELARRNPDDPSSPLDFDVLDQLQATLMAEVEGGLFGPPDRAMEIIDERRRFLMPESMVGYMDNKDYIRKAGYWDTKDGAFARVRERVNGEAGFEDVASAGELEARVLHLQASDPRTAARMAQYVSMINSLSSKQHEQMRRQDPALDRALFENGYITKRVTRDQ